MSEQVELHYKLSSDDNSPHENKKPFYQNHFNHFKKNHNKRPFHHKKHF